LNFLIEVDWGQGRLVREYAAMVDAPATVAAASQPTIDAAQVARDNVIERPVAAAPSAPPGEPAPTAAAPAPEPTADTRVASAPTPPAGAAPAPAPSFDGADSVTVGRGQTLSQIAAQVASGYSIDQTMIALLRANPDAFIRGNINRLKQGAVLRVPQAGDVAQLGETEAAALVRSQIAEWRQARRPIPQPAAIANNDPAAATAAPRVADARLEIAPPLASAATRAGTQSGVDAGGEGDMLANEQLQQSKEELAARDAEVQELRSQVAELEKLKQQQTKLIAMKDSDLAAAQQRLEQSPGATAGTPIWVWAGWGLLIIGALAWILSSRRKRVAPTPAKPSKVFGNAELAAAMPNRPDAGAVAAATASDVPVSAPVAEVEPVATPAPTPAAPAAKPAKPAPTPAKPTWHSGDVAASVAPLNSAPAGRERLELAIAYLDLGDTLTARDLLNEVVAGNDDVARQEALQLLRDLG
ncbi:MAG TPA: FimV/HubP family polar landmark protein, partial [Pseudoxanthomonas sp.]|nr:FimV/HubP family polar landmark protein [Pseudoxanthomonas sp.]